MTTPLTTVAGRNADYSWASFDSDIYFKHNYAQLREDDREILKIVRQFFVEELGTPQEPGLRGIDVGTGVNLYPAFTMLPFCREITLYEYSPRNVDWLNEGAADGWRASWAECHGEFWEVLESEPQYGAVEHPLEKLTDRSRIVRGSIYELPPRQWDIGTMFFVAESITQEDGEFRAGLDRFLGALTPDAPFVIAFMEHRVKGYHVGVRPFPSTDIDQADVVGYLRHRASIDIDRNVHHIGVGSQPLEDPYTGMVVACGRVRA